MEKEPVTIAEDYGHKAIRSNFDTRVTSSTPVPVAEELRAADRQTGWMVINKWIYRLIRLAMSRMNLPYDNSGVTVSDMPEIGSGAVVVTPTNVTGTGAVYLIHGGGLVIGRNKDLLPNAADLARGTGVPVICPSYRLAPDHPAPAAIDDVHSGWQDLQSHAAKMGIDAEKIVVGGVSAGGGLAAVLAQRLLDEGGIQPAAQLLIYPMLDDRTAARREIDKPRHRVWSNRNNLFGWSSYLGQKPGGEVPKYRAASRREDVAGLPPAWIGIGTCDLFLDENREYVQRLRDAQVDVTYFEVDGAIHGFDTAQTEMGKAFGALQETFIRKFTD